jgi:peptidoglycan/LPS O-acetylase OafA/YrhL
MNNDNSTSAVATAAVVVVIFYSLFIAIALHKVRLPQSTWWYTLGALTYPLYLLHNQIGKAIAATVVTQVGEVAAILLGMVVPLVLAWILAKTVEKKGCPWLRKRVSKTAQRLGFVARPEQARP